MFSEEDMEKMNKEYEEGGYREREIFNNLLTKIYEYNDSHPRNASKKLENTLGIMYIHEKYYAIEGGTCWDAVDEDNSYEVDIGDKSVASGLVSGVTYMLGQEFKELSVKDSIVNEWIEKNVRSKGKYSYITDYFQSEYYGNSSTYGIYKVDLNVLIEEVCSDKEKKIYKEVVEKFKPPVKNKHRFY